MEIKLQKLAVVIDGPNGYVIDGSGTIIAQRPAEVLVSCSRDQAVCAVKNYKRAQCDARLKQQEWQTEREWHHRLSFLLGQHRYRQQYAETDKWKIRINNMVQTNRYRVKANVVRSTKRRDDESWDRAVKRFVMSLNNSRSYYAKDNVWKRWAGNVASNNRKRQERKEAQKQRHAEDVV